MTLALIGWLTGVAGLGVAAWLWRILAWQAESAARAAHELRGPITAARLGLRLISREGSGAAERARVVELELARAGLALQDLEQGLGGGHGTPPLPPRKLECVDVAALAHDSVAAWHAFALEHAAALSVSGVPGCSTVVGDRCRLSQALGNLIANAIEHAGGGEIDVRLSGGSGSVRVEVCDYGPGLPAPVDELAGRARLGRGRRGRGLAIALAVASAHGGRLFAAPAMRGARLVLELPASDMALGADRGV